MTLNAYIRKEERRKEISLLELNFPLKKLKNNETKEVIKSVSQLNRKWTSSGGGVNENQSWFFEKINKINKKKM